MKCVNCNKVTITRGYRRYVYSEVIKRGLSVDIARLASATCEKCLKGRAKLSAFLNEVTDLSCVLCGKRSKTIGVFIPHNPLKFGGDPMKARVFKYTICDECLVKPDHHKLVEEFFIKANNHSADN